MKYAKYSEPTTDIHKMLRKTLCSNRIAISAKKSEYVYNKKKNGGTHNERENRKSDFRDEKADHRR